MPFDFFQNGIDNNMLLSPNEAIRNMQQAAIDARWDVTTTKYAVKEQDDFGTKTYHDIEVWIDYVVGMSSRGTTNGDDFRQLIFQDINHPVERGLYYRFDEAVWLTYFTDEYSSLVKDIGVRRCNNALRMVDPENGAIFSVPCVIDYDMTSPSPQISSHVITPNNHAVVMVQGNKDTIRLFKINTRFILGGRAFKLMAYQNALIDKELATYPTLLYLDLYLDELHAGDDIENQLADNGELNYEIKINAEDMELPTNTTGTLTASVTLNGNEVKRDVIWESTNPDIVTIDDDGNFRTGRQSGGSCQIIAYIKGNKQDFVSINISVIEQEGVKPKILFVPAFDKIRQYETIEFEVKVAYGDDIIDPMNSNIELSKSDSHYIELTKNGNQYSLTGRKIANQPIVLNVSARNDDPNFEVNTDFNIKVTSMLG